MTVMGHSGLRRVAALLAGVLALLSCAPPARAAIDYPSAFACDAAKFNWYCDEEPQKKPDAPTKPQAKAPKQKQPDQSTALQRLEALQQRLKEARAKAVLEPTPEHVAEYIRLQNEVGQMAGVFSDVWRRVIWQNPELNYELKRPVNNAAIDTYNKERFKKEMQALDAIKKEWGIFFFFRSDCPFCHRMAPTLRFLSDAYGLTVFPVSIDGRGIPEYPNPQPDNGLAERLSVKSVPMLVLGNPKTKQLIPLGSGVISAQEVIERIYILTSTRPGDLY